MTRALDVLGFTRANGVPAPKVSSLPNFSGRDSAHAFNDKRIKQKTEEVEQPHFRT